MVEIASPATQLHSPPAGKSHSTSGRQRIIASCLTCRRRKVRCDHGHPICGACTRGHHVCNYATDQWPDQTSSSRVSKPVTQNGKSGSRNSDVQARLDRLESLLEKAVSGHATSSEQPVPSNGEGERREFETQTTPSSTSQTSQTAAMSSDNNDGTLLLDEGKSQFVSSLHYALLADEIQDIKAILGASEERRDVPTRNSMVHLLSLGRAQIGVTLQTLFPETKEQRDALLDIYFSNVDPMVRVTHKPTLLCKFPNYVDEAHPMSFAVFYSAIVSLPSSVVENKFGNSKEELLSRFELGVQIGLARENYLTTSSLEVFQAFLIWLTCISAEDDIGKAWALLGVAIRIALHQGLHRDPSLFPTGSMDSVTIELRRRAWHQVCNLEFRAAECKGQEPSISDDSYTAMLPRNIEDDELIEGASPGPNAYDAPRFTNMTFQLVRYVGMIALRRIVQSTYRLERRMLESGLRGITCPDPAQELHSMYEQIKILVHEMHEENRQKYMRFCNPDISIQRLTLGLASMLEWRCYLIFWLRMPRAYRDIVFGNDIRILIFEKSINCMEALNGASVDSDIARYQWHIGGHAGFQAILHILSELRNPLFVTPDRSRALRVLQMSRLLKENNHSKAWLVVKGMIDKALDESATPVACQPKSSNTYASPTHVPPSNPANFNFPIPFVGQMSPYSIQRDPELFVPQPIQPTQPIQSEPNVFNWDELHFNNIVGDVSVNPELPEFDWGFWGDPVNFDMIEPANVTTFPMDGTYTSFPN